MRTSGIFTLVCVLWQAFQGLGAADLTSYHDATRLLENPHKGWYHHYWDNGDWGYGGSVSDITSVPGLDFLYVRMAWSFFEKTENSYDWSYISDVADTYGPKGYNVVVCFTSLETGASNDSRYEPEVDATVHYATPCWVKDKGCSGSWEEAYGKWHWQPDWDDPIYLAELEDFYRAFYDTFGSEPWLKLMDMGSIGEWGEGHCGHTTHKYVPTVAEVKANIDVYNSVFQQNGIQVTIGDDYAAWAKSESDKNAIADYANARGFGWTDLSIGNWYWQESHSSTYGVANPELFENHYLNAPVTMEMGHYHLRISDKFNTWSEPDGSAVYGEPGYGNMTHYDILTKQIETMHASYASMHGHIDKWLPDNSNTIRTLGNLMGYWYFIDEATWDEGIAAGDEWSFSLDWYNRGVAPAYNTYQLKLKLDGPSPKTFTIDDSKNKDWVDGERETESYSVTLPTDMSSGTYDVKLKLYDPQTDRDVDLGFVTSIKDADGYFDLGEVNIGRTTTKDTTPPKLESVTVPDETSVRVRFDEPVTKESAENPGNYSISDDIGVSGATLDDDTRSVMLTVSTLTLKKTFTLTVSNITDRASSPNSGGDQKQFSYAGEMQISGVTVASGASYEIVQHIAEGGKQYIDRAFTFVSLGDFAGRYCIRTANADKTRSGDQFLTFTARQPVTVYIAYDSRIAAPASWLSSWNNDGEGPGISEAYPDGITVYTRSFDAGDVSLGANAATEYESMYSVFIDTDDVTSLSHANRRSADPASTVRVSLSGAIVRVGGLHAGRAYTITLTDARGRVASVRKTVRDNGTVSLSTSLRSRGVYIIDVRSAGHGARMKALLN